MTVYSLYEEKTSSKTHYGLTLFMSILDDENGNLISYDLVNRETFIVELSDMDEYIARYGSMFRPSIEECFVRFTENEKRTELGQKINLDQVVELVALMKLEQ